jgi:hypothetical protein
LRFPIGRGVQLRRARDVRDRNWVLARRRIIFGSIGLVVRLIFRFVGEQIKDPTRFRSSNIGEATMNQLDGGGTRRLQW